MKKWISLTILIAILMPLPVIASDITNATYSGTVQATNNSTATSEVATVFTANITDYDATGENTTIRDNVDNDVAFSPPYPGSNIWNLWVDAISEDTSVGYTLYTDTVTDGKIRYFPGSTGMTINDDPTMEPSDNFSVELPGWYDTSYASANQTYVDKTNALKIWNGASGNITAQLPYGGPGVDTLPTGTNDPSAAWTDDANAIDDNTGTYAPITAAVAATTWSAYFEVTFPSTSVNGAYVYVYSSATSRQMDIEYYDTGWHNIYTGTFVDTTWITKPVSYASGVTKLRIRFYNGDGTAKVFRIHEFHYLLSSAAQVSASGISSGEKIVKVSMDSPFLSMRIDSSSDNITPVTENLTMNIPLPQSECSISPFTTIDSNVYTVTNNGATWTSQGYSFDHINDYLSTNFDPPPFGFTAIVWLKTPITASADNVRGILDKSDAGSEWKLFLRTSSSRFSFRSWDGTGAENPALEFSAATAITANTWYQLALTYDRATNTRTGYVNTVSAGSLATGSAIRDTASIIRIGEDALAANRYWDGYIGDIEFYDRVLSQTEIEQNYNATKSKYTIGDIYTYSTLASVPDNANDWIVGYNGTALKYMNTFSFTQGGIERCNLSWEYGTTFTDATGNGNDGTPSFRTTSSDADVSAIILSFAPITEASATTFTLGDRTDILTTAPSNIPQLYSEMTFTYLPGAEVVNSMLTAADIPQAFWWFPFVFIGIALIGMLVYGATTMRMNAGRISDEGAQGTLLLSIIIIECLLALFGVMRVIPFWTALLFPIWAGGWITSTKHQTLG